MPVVKKMVRGSKNFYNNYSDIEKKVRDATSVDAWMVSTSVLREIAEATYDRKLFSQVMGVLLKRMGDSGKRWRHVLKSLLVLDYLLKNGAEQVLDVALENIHHIRTLKEFTYDGEDGIDHGHDIREKARKITELIKNPELLTQERANAAEISRRLGNHVDHGNRGRSSKMRGEPASSAEEEEQLARALAESRIGGETEEALQQREEEELVRALAESEKEAKREAAKREAEEKERQYRSNSTVTHDPFADAFGATAALSDPFAAPQVQAPGHVDVFAAPHEQPTQDPFSRGAVFGDQHAAPTAAPTAAAISSSTTTALAPPPSSTRRRAGNSNSNIISTNTNTLDGTGSSSSDPQHMLADIARNAVEIDGFSRLAHGRVTAQHDPFGHSPVIARGGGDGATQPGGFVDPFQSTSTPQTMMMSYDAAAMAASPVPAQQPTQPIAPIALLQPTGTAKKIDDDVEDGSLWKNKKLVNLDEITAVDNRNSHKMSAGLVSTPMNPFALGPISPAKPQPPQPQRGPAQANPFKQNNASPKMNALMDSNQPSMSGSMSLNSTGYSFAAGQQSAVPVGQQQIAYALPPQSQQHVINPFGMGSNGSVPAAYDLGSSYGRHAHAASAANPFGNPQQQQMAGTPINPFM